MLMAGGGNAALAQTVEYFSVPQFVPQNPNSQTTGEAPFPGSSQETSPYGAGTSSLYGQYLAQSAASAPPWLLTEHVGINEVATDNVNYPSPSPRQADLSSLFSAGGILTADSDHVYGTLALTGVYRLQAVESHLDALLGYGYANAMVSVLPGTLYLGVHGLMDEVYRTGLGLQNPFSQVADLTQVYQVSASPLFYSRFDDLTFNLLRYEIGQAWFNENTGTINSQGQILFPVSGSTDQIARDDLRFDGTVIPRLMTDVSLYGATYNSTSQSTGDFTREKGQIINEYALTHSLALIGAAGYERLHDRHVPLVDGQGVTWSVGARYLPNADSYALLTYGKNDLKSDFAGELGWQVTPLTSVYMDYTDSVITLQQLEIANNNASSIGPFGATTRIAFDESPIISTLGDPLLLGPPSPENPASNLGVPLFDVNNVLPLENGLFRVKAYRASANTRINNDNVVGLTFMDFDQTQLSSRGPFVLGHPASLQQAILSWGRFLSPAVQARVGVSYGHLSEDQTAGSVSTSSNRYGATLILNWQITETLAGQLRYDYLNRDTHPSSVSADQNVLSIGLYKTFD